MVALLVAGSVVPARTASQQAPYEPTVGQAGKDVIWVPTPEAMVRA